MTSAKTGKGVEEVFLHLTKQMLQAHHASGADRKPQSRSFVQIVDTAEKDNKGCCS